MAVSKQRFKQAAALRSVVLRMVQWAPEGAAQDIRRIAERPLDDWTDGDIESMKAWIVQYGEETGGRRLERQLDLLTAVVGTLPQTDPLCAKIEQFFGRALSAETHSEAYQTAAEDLNQLVEEATKRLV